MVGMHPCHASVGSMEPNPLVISILATWGAGWLAGWLDLGTSYVASSYAHVLARLVLHSYTAKKKQQLLDTHGCHDTLAT